MHRREFLKTAGALASSAYLAADAPKPLDLFKLGAISDGFSQDFEEALKILTSYGLKWVEIREVFGVYNTEASSTQIHRVRQLLDQYQFRVSVIDSALYKCTLPGTRPLAAENDAFPYPRQMDLLKRACERAHTLGANKIRGFTFWRVSEPGKVSQRVAEELTRAADVASNAGMRLVIENEESCNAATGRELAQVLRLAPAQNLGANWDVGNGYLRGEVSFPDGYAALDKSRIWHMHLKGISCQPRLHKCSEDIVGSGQIDLAGQFQSLLRDGYQQTMSLECEFEAPGLSHADTTRRSMENLLKVIRAASNAR